MGPRLVIGFLMCFLPMFASCSKGGTNESKTSSAGSLPAKGQSASWKVEIVSAKCDSSALVLRFRVEYTGPSGIVPAPPLVVRDSKWERIQGEKVLLEKREGELYANPETLTWLFSIVRALPNDPRTIQTGEKFEFGAFYSFGTSYNQLPCWDRNLTVLFGDVPPINF
jgi:hypothetical protein